MILTDATLTLAMPNKGLFVREAIGLVGELYAGDISVPKKRFQEKSLGLEATNIFRYSNIVRLHCYYYWIAMNGIRKMIA